MFQGGAELAALGGVVAEPMEELREAPLGGIYPAAPFDGREARAMGGLRDERGFAPRAMVAPEIIIVNRLEVAVDGNDARPCGIDGDGLDGFTRDLGGGQRIGH